MFRCLSLSAVFAISLLLIQNSQAIGQSSSRGAGRQLQSGAAVVQQGQSGSGARGAGMGSGSRGQAIGAAEATFEQKLWSYLLRAKYRNWAPVPGESDAMYDGQSPHGAFLKMYLNRVAAGEFNNLRNGSMIVKENYTPDRALAAVTVMYKTKGYHPSAGDWYWVKFNPDGSVATKPDPSGAVRLAGRVAGCIECHSGAAGDDFAFFND